MKKIDSLLELQVSTIHLQARIQATADALMRRTDQPVPPPAWTVSSTYTCFDLFFTKNALHRVHRVHRVCVTMLAAVPETPLAPS